ncbi:hypothetical protein EYF80_060246 [Liparis tanakae]|uniref:Uncharacterized protein n=1 Tax=Liparis tanakae TaxID=230148 RepID=A0A4Z2EMC8_9TELE|nr:hypothetical protein EYF80_060246 [Liparis tanakae]
MGMGAAVTGALDVKLRFKWYHLKSERGALNAASDTCKVDASGAQRPLQGRTSATRKAVLKFTYASSVEVSDTRRDGDCLAH